MKFLISLKYENVLKIIRRLNKKKEKKSGKKKSKKRIKGKVMSPISVILRDLNPCY